MGQVALIKTKIPLPRLKHERVQDEQLESPSYIPNSQMLKASGPCQV